MHLIYIPSGQALWHWPRSTLRSGQKTKRSAACAFSRYSADGTIDRKILGRIVFDQTEKLKKLNAIVHPAVNEKIREEMQKAQEEEKELSK